MANGATFGHSAGLLGIISLQFAASTFDRLPAAGDTFWTMHILDAHYTGPANKDTGNQECVVGFVAFYCFGQQPTFSKVNSEMHVADTVLEQVQVTPLHGLTSNKGDYLSCCPPGCPTNPGNYYRCNKWTTEANDNCHTPNLPFNDGQLTKPGAQVPDGSTPVSGVQQLMYSWPSEGEGTMWKQGLTRRIKMSTLAGKWIQEAGGCNACQGKSIEDPCFGGCIKGALDVPKLLKITDDAYADLKNFPNYGIPDNTGNMQGIVLSGQNKCLDLSGGDSSYGTGIDLWDCNGMVNQAWYWSDYKIQLGGHNLPGMCIDLPGGNAKNGNKLWIWGCNGQDSQNWVYDQTTQTIRYAKNQHFCIDIPGGTIQNGNQLWLWSCVPNLATQKWSLYKKALTEDNHGVGETNINTTRKSYGGVSWMHEMKKLMSAHSGNISMPPDHVPWYERKAVKEWYAAQMPTPGLPRPLVPANWTGYSTSTAEQTLLV
jgi:hypothetical protein